MGKLVSLGKCLIYVQNPYSYRCEALYGSFRGYPYQINQTILNLRVIFILGIDSHLHLTNSNSFDNFENNASAQDHDSVLLDQF